MPKRALSSYTSMRAEALTERACVGTGQGPQAPAGARGLQEGARPVPKRIWACPHVPG